MRLKGLLILISGAFFSFRSAAQRVTELSQSRVLLLLDGSSSMLGQWGGVKPKSKVAQEIILKLMDSVYAVNPNVEFSLRVFGHQSTVPEHDCHDTRNEVPFSKHNRQQMEYRLDDIKPLGVTSIAYSLRQAALSDLTDEERNVYSIILITDGGESCGGNICEVMKMLVSRKVFFRPYIIGLEDVPGLQKEYECMGDYLQVTAAGDIPKAIGIIVEAFKPVLKMTSEDYKELKATPRIEEVRKIDPPKVEAPKVETPPVVTRPAPVSIAAMQPRSLRAISIMVPAQGYQAPAKVPELNIMAPAEPVAVIEKPASVSMARLSPAKLTRIPVAAPAPGAYAAVAVPGLPDVELTPVKPAAERYARMAPSKPAAISIARAERPVLRMVSSMPALPALAPEPVKPAAEAMTRLTASRLAVVTVPAPRTKTFRAARIPALPEVVPEVVKPAAESIPRIALSRIRQFSIMWVMDDRGFAARPVPPMPAIKMEIPKAATTAVKAVPVDPNAPKQMEYIAAVEEAKETTLQVYFTDGHGKFYTSTPQILLLDRTTHKTAKQFYRTVDPNGNPDAQPDIKPGSYDLTFAAKRGFVLSNIKIEPNKRNTITVKLPKPTLSFAYGEPGDMSRSSTRPVSEFEATVIERNKDRGRVQRQKGTEAIEYEPGNYHIEITTFPQDIRNVDLDFGETIITIPQPGFVKFSPADDKVASVTIYQRMGDRFLKFHTIPTSDVRSKHLNLQPGEYQAHYNKGPGGALAEKVKPFFVRSVQEVEVILD
ncbi:MAG: hypothetical protein V4649_03705 [Bacteroidota bacterium]